MHFSLVFLTFITAALARPINEGTHGKDRIRGRESAADNSIYVPPFWNVRLHRREVPQEHSHEKFLTTVDEFLFKNNPDNIVDAVFGLLGDDAAAGGQGSVSNTDCLQQATADQAFTNAKAAGDVDGMTAALVYRALERNTGQVGLASVPCTAITAVNPEIAAISQHQDPASPNAAAINKGIALELAKQIASIGGDPTIALQSGTFAPGNIGDPTAKGNSCDDQNDPQGCIFTQNLLVEDATEDEVLAAVGSTSAGASTTIAAVTECPAPPASVTDSPTTVSSTPASTSVTTSASASASASTSTTTTSNLDFGSCPNPTIIFADNLDGRNQPSFEPADETAFPHGSALGIQVITDFICQQLGTKCKAPQSTVAACNAAAAAALQQTGQAAADAFNAALGF